MSNSNSYVKDNPFPVQEKRSCHMHEQKNLGSTFLFHKRGSDQVNKNTTKRREDVDDDGKKERQR